MSCSIIIAACVLYCTSFTDVRDHFNEVAKIDQCPTWTLILDRQLDKGLSWRNIDKRFATLQTYFGYCITGKAPCRETRASYIRKQISDEFVPSSQITDLAKNKSPDNIDTEHDLAKDKSPDNIDTEQRTYMPGEEQTTYMPREDTNLDSDTNRNKPTWPTFDNSSWGIDDSPPWIVSIIVIALLMAGIYGIRQVRRYGGHNLGGKGRRKTAQFYRILKAVEARSKETLKRKLPEDFVDEIFSDTITDKSTQTVNFNNTPPASPSQADATDESISNIDVDENNDPSPGRDSLACSNKDKMKLRHLKRPTSPPPPTPDSYTVDSEEEKKEDKLYNEEARYKNSPKTYQNEESYSYDKTRALVHQGHSSYIDESDTADYSLKDMSEFTIQHAHNSPTAMLDGTKKKRGRSTFYDSGVYRGFASTPNTPDNSKFGYPNYTFSEERAGLYDQDTPYPTSTLPKTPNFSNLKMDNVVTKRNKSYLRKIRFEIPDKEDEYDMYETLEDAIISVEKDTLTGENEVVQTTAL